MPSEKQIEQEIQAKVLTAPRITPDHVEACIVKEQYHVFEGTTVTACLLTLPNGAKVIGHNYGSVSLENQNWDLGRKYAREMAVEKIWELEGYLLRQRLHEASQIPVDANFVGGLTSDGTIEGRMDSENAGIVFLD